MQPVQSVQSVESAEPGGAAESSPFVTADRAAEILHMSPEHVRRAIADGVIPGFRFGRAYRAFRPFIDGLLAEMEEGRFVDIGAYAATKLAKVSEGVA
jgi:excisionase family DNA binding protein